MSARSHLESYVPLLGIKVTDTFVLRQYLSLSTVVSSEPKLILLIPVLLNLRIRSLQHSSTNHCTVWFKGADLPSFHARLHRIGSHCRF